jgi:hypothetical protein
MIAKHFLCFPGFIFRKLLFLFSFLGRTNESFGQQ